MTHYIVHQNSVSNNNGLQDSSASGESTFVDNDVTNYSEPAAVVIDDQSRINDTAANTNPVVVDGEPQLVEEEGIVYSYQDENGVNTMYVISQVLDENGQIINVAIPVEASTATSTTTELTSNEGGEEVADQYSSVPTSDSGLNSLIAATELAVAVTNTTENVQAGEEDITKTEGQKATTELAAPEVLEEEKMPATTTETGTSSSGIATINGNGTNYIIRKEENHHDYDLPMDEEPTTEITLQEEGAEETTDSTTTTEFQIFQSGNHVIVRRSDGSIVNEFTLPQRDEEVKQKATSSSSLRNTNITKKPTKTNLNPKARKPRSTPGSSSLQRDNDKNMDPPIPIIQQHYLKIEPNISQPPRQDLLSNFRINRLGNNSSSHTQQFQSLKSTPISTNNSTTPTIQIIRSEPSMNFNRNKVKTSKPMPNLSIPKKQQTSLTSHSIQATTPKRPRYQDIKKVPNKNCKVLIRSEAPAGGSKIQTNGVTLLVKQEMPSTELNDNTCYSEPNTSSTPNHSFSSSGDDLDLFDSDMDLIGLPFSYNGQSFNLQSQKLILNVYDFFRKTKSIGKCFESPRKNPEQKASSVLNVSSSVIGKIRKRYNAGKLDSPSACTKKLGFKRILDQVDDKDEATIREIIKDCSRKGETNIPKLLQEARNRIGFMGSRTSFRRVLARMGFQYAKFNKRTVILSVKEENLPSSSNSSLNLSQGLSSPPALIPTPVGYSISSGNHLPVSVSTNSLFTVSYPISTLPVKTIISQQPIISDNGSGSELLIVNNDTTSSTELMESEEQHNNMFGIVKDEVTISTSL